MKGINLGIHQSTQEDRCVKRLQVSSALVDMLERDLEIGSQALRAQEDLTDNSKGLEVSCVVCLLSGSQLRLSLLPPLPSLPFCIFFLELYAG